MTLRRIAALSTAAVVASSVALAAAPAHAAPGTTDLASVLDADGNEFDANNHDFDIVDRAVRTVLEAKPDSAVSVLADGETRVTAFLPTDGAFRRLVYDVSGDWISHEGEVFTAVAGLGVDTVESVLLYHVVPGMTIGYAKAAAADGTKLPTALEDASLTLNITKNAQAKLRDADTDDKNARVLPELRNINQGNKQIAHGINRVMRPTDL